MTRIPGWGACLGFCLCAFLGLRSPYVFDSLESKNQVGESVRNEIHFKFGIKKDLWWMRQWQDSKKPEPDLLLIEVDKTTSPFSVKFFQGDPKTNQKMGFAVSCYRCHANGPRAIRPVSSSIQNSFQRALLNLRIITYGRVFTQSLIEPGFRPQEAVLQKPLRLKSCQGCHNKEGFAVRGELTFEHLETARFLVEKGLMPPPFFRVDKSTKRILGLID